MRYLEGVSGEDEYLGSPVQFELLGVEDCCRGGIILNLLGVSSALPTACFSQPSPDNFYPILSAHLRIACGLESGDRFLFGGNCLLAVIGRGALNQAQKTVCWLPNFERTPFARRHSGDSYPFDGLKAKTTEFGCF